MDKPVVASKEPVWVDVKKDESYWWCTCGRSQSQPFCDGSHAGTSFTPSEYVATRDRKLRFCACKATKTGPFCDDAHLELP